MAMPPTTLASSGSTTKVSCMLMLGIVPSVHLLQSSRNSCRGTGIAEGKVNTNMITDDASLVERLGQQVKIFTGSEENIKITTQVDLLLAEVILKHRGNPKELSPESRRL